MLIVISVLSVLTWLIIFYLICEPFVVLEYKKAKYERQYKEACSLIDNWNEIHKNDGSIQQSYPTKRTCWY